MEMLDYLKSQIEKLKSLGASSGLTQDEKFHCNSELIIYTQLKEKLEWLELPPQKKQATRITWLATARNNQMKSIIPLMNNISLYSKIVETEPYIIALNHNSELSGLLTLCIKEKRLIDSEPYAKKHVSTDEVEKAFKAYFEIRNTVHEDFFSEARLKIEELYDRFIQTIQ
jgi:hypothetical protein